MKTCGSTIALAVVLFTLLLGGVAQAEPHHFGGERFEQWGWHGPAGHWDGRAGWGWRREDLDRWHGGYWLHGDHLGRLAWWWVVGDGWYFYPAPVYPYPDPYVPPAVGGPLAGYWYYCPSAGAYYPYVSQCPEPWTPVLPSASAVRP
jgi:hypothetical protein